MKCKHPKRFVVDLGEMRRCYRCGDHLTLGPSNDDVPPEEIIAAELGQSSDVWEAWQNCDRGIEDDLDRLGVRGFLQLGASSPEAKHAFLTPPAFQDELDLRDYWAGWLARDLARGFAWGPVETEEAWTWDTSRPVAGQHEDHTARGDAMLHEAIGNPLEAEHAREIRGISDLPLVERVPQDGWQERALAKVDSFAPVDSASHEPWHTTDETQPSGSLKTKPWPR